MLDPKQTQIDLKRSYGLENLHFYELPKRLNYYCKYISNPNDFEISINNTELTFLLNSLSRQQGKVYFEDYGKCCIGIDQLKLLYLPMKLGEL